jgi:hypothetical protein
VKAVVVFESLWGNTAAIAEAIAEGLGADATALSTSKATASVLEGMDLVIAGAPVHMMHIPTASTREKARRRGERKGVEPADLSQQPMAEWLRALPRARGFGAAFDTRIASQRGGCSATRIARGLKRRGYSEAAVPERFMVEPLPGPPGSGVKLREGELDRAREWGAMLARHPGMR